MQSSQSNLHNQLRDEQFVPSQMPKVGNLTFNPSQLRAGNIIQFVPNQTQASNTYPSTGFSDSPQTQVNHQEQEQRPARVNSSMSQYQ